jgi:hypothetical protein
MHIQIYDSERQRDICEIAHLIYAECQLSIDGLSCRTYVLASRKLFRLLAFTSFDDRVETVVNSVSELIRSKENDENT